METKKARKEGTEARINYNYLVDQKMRWVEMGEYFVCRGKESPEGKAGIRGREEAEKLIILAYRRGQCADICHGCVIYPKHTLCKYCRFPLQTSPLSFRLNRFIIKPSELPQLVGLIPFWQPFT